LARSFGRDGFIKAMKNISANIGAYGTFWEDPSGLGAGNVSSAYDMAIILDHIYRNKNEVTDLGAKISGKVAEQHFD
jgi:D-alanyl-D-alanine carboxypeptidase